MTDTLIASDLSEFNGQQVVDDLNRLLRLRTTPIGMKMFRTGAEMEAIPKIKATQTGSHHRSDRGPG